MTNAEKKVLSIFKWNITPLRARDLQKFTGHNLLDAGNICHSLFEQGKLMQVTVSKWHWYFCPEFVGTDPEDREADSVDWGIY